MSGLSINDIEQSLSKLSKQELAIIANSIAKQFSKTRRKKQSRYKKTEIDELINEVRGHMADMDSNQVTDLFHTVLIGTLNNWAKVLNRIKS
jgi:hypothetical protein